MSYPPSYNRGMKMKNKNRPAIKTNHETAPAIAHSAMPGTGYASRTRRSANRSALATRSRQSNHPLIQSASMPLGNDGNQGESTLIKSNQAFQMKKMTQSLYRSVPYPFPLRSTKHATLLLGRQTPDPINPHQAFEPLKNPRNQGELSQIKPRKIIMNQTNPSSPNQPEPTSVKIGQRRRTSAASVYCPRLTPHASNRPPLPQPHPLVNRESAIVSHARFDYCSSNH
jgi:hypothetical protein